MSVSKVSQKCGKQTRSFRSKTQWICKHDHRNTDLYVKMRGSWAGPSFSWCVLIVFIDKWTFDREGWRPQAANISFYNAFDQSSAAFNAIDALTKRQGMEWHMFFFVWRAALDWIRLPTRCDSFWSYAATPRVPYEHGGGRSVTSAGWPWPCFLPVVATAVVVTRQTRTCHILYIRGVQKPLQSLRC